MAETAAERDGRADAFAAARRHSTRVRRLRRVIPLASGTVVAGLVAVAILDPFRAVPAGFEVKGVGLNGTRITMELPKLAGFKKDLRPYEVTAKAAVQDIRNVNVIELEELEARFALEAGSAAKVTARTGVYDTSKELLDLAGDVRVTTDSGYDVRLATARIEFKSGAVQSRDPVDVGMSGGRVLADGFDILDNGKTIVFTGRVRATLDAEPAAKPAKADAAPVATTLVAPSAPAPRVLPPAPAPRPVTEARR